MQDYSKLVEDLRNGVGYWYMNNSSRLVSILGDAADAIEALMPKRGEWIEDTTTYAGPGLSNHKCSLCGKICGTWRSGLKPSELPNWCGNCGADMRKMEVQE